VNPVLIVTHMSDRAVGIVRESLQSAGCPVIERNPADPDPLPNAAELSGVVSLGGRQSATRVDADPFIAAMYAGWPELVTLPAAADDPVCSALPDRLPVLKWHEDFIELPPGAHVLGATPGPDAALFRNLMAGPLHLGRVRPMFYAFGRLTSGVTSAA
jgi:GMP synthase-like glutamine amidotransferase